MEDEWYIKKIEGEDFVYHCFIFNPQIQEHTFLGESFLGMDQVDETRNLQMLGRVIDAGPFGFMPKLVEELQNILGESYYRYDGYEIGEDVFALYFFIKRSHYHSLLNKVKQWAAYHEISHLVDWDNKE